MLISKPGHSNYVFNFCDEIAYELYANNYAMAKKVGFRACVALFTSVGVWGIVKEAIRGEVRTWGRKKLGTLILSSCGWAGCAVIPLVTNSTKIIKGAKVIHNNLAYCGEVIEDSANLVWLPLDLICFGQPIPIGVVNRFHLMGKNTTDTDPFIFLD